MLFRTICFFLRIPGDVLATQYQILTKSCLTYCYQRGCRIPHLPLGASPHPFACSWKEMSHSAEAGHSGTVLGEAGGRSCFWSLARPAAGLLSHLPAGECTCWARGEGSQPVAGDDAGATPGRDRQEHLCLGRCQRKGRDFPLEVPLLALSSRRKA